MSVSNRVDGTDRLDPHQRWVVATLVLGAIGPMIDTTAVNVGLRAIAVDFGVGLAAAAWVATGYLLAVTTTIPLVGWLESALGPRRLWQSAIAVFLVGSVLCSVAPTIELLIGCRIFQGAGAGVLMTQMQALSMRAAGARRARMVAAISLPVALGPVIGPALGGLVLSGWSWRWIFVINVPTCVAAMVLANRTLSADRTTPARPKVTLDVPGAVLMTFGLAVLTFGLTRFENGGGYRWGTAAVMLGVLALLGFGYWAVRRGSAALLNLGLLQTRSLGVSTAVMFLMGVSVFGALFLVPVWWQDVRGADYLTAALALVPLGLGSVAVKFVIAPVVARYGAAHVAAAAFLVIVVATAPFLWLDSESPVLTVVVLTFVRGVGVGAVIVPLLAAAYQGIANAEAAQASMLTRSAQQVGASVGVALAATIAADGAVSSLRSAFAVLIAATLLAAGVSLMLGETREPRR